MKRTPPQLADIQAAIAADNDGLPWQDYEHSTTRTPGSWKPCTTEEKE